MSIPDCRARQAADCASREPQFPLEFQAFLKGLYFLAQWSAFFLGKAAGLCPCDLE